jgi:ABC-type branched-subunit amino acid transport system permease subunit
VAGLDVVSILLVNFVIYFGQYVVIATALNLQFGNVGIPNISSNISVACGAYVVSSVVIRICMWIGGAAGLIFRPDWVTTTHTTSP